MMRSSLPLLVIALAACGGASATTPAAAPAPVPAAPPHAVVDSIGNSPLLPPVPLVTGALDIHVAYPTPNALIESRDSNFIFGTVGNGHAALAIDGVRVPVYSNGAFIAFLPNPPQDAPRYDLVATLGADTVRLAYPVRLLPPRPVLAATGPLVVDSASVAPRAALTLLPGEPVRVSVRAPANASAWLVAGTAQLPLVNGAAAPVPLAGAVATGMSSPGTPVVGGAARGDSLLFATDVPARALAQGGTIVVARGADTVRLPVPSVATMAPDSLPLAVLGGADTVAADSERTVIGRPTPGGTYKWFLFPGTVVRLTGRSGDFARVRLDSTLDIWVPASEVALLPAGAAAPRRVTSDATVSPADGWVDVAIPVGERPPYLVEERGHDLVLTLYGARSATDIVHYVANDSLVRSVEWEQVGNDRVRFTLHLAIAPYGYLPLWDHGRFILRVRRPPRIDRNHPLAGLTIAVDAGHPPIGATGPTGLWEPNATLPIAQKLQQILQQRGATVVMTRTTPAPVALTDRPVIARRANANALISIHLNALPDGINPFTTNGTGAYFFLPQAEPLARAVQNGMVRQMELRNLGVNYDNLALARPTWMPSVLCEGAFIIMPAQEAALRTPEFQERYARGVADGIEAFFRELGRQR